MGSVSRANDQGLVPQQALPCQLQEGGWGLHAHSEGSAGKGAWEASGRGNLSTYT
jgi:hypothetical protein